LHAADALRAKTTTKAAHPGGLDCCSVAYTRSEHYDPGMLIKAYGEYWNRAKIDWTVGVLGGRLKGKIQVNAWNQRGVYALYDHFNLVYIGQAESQDLGKRLRQHHTDRFAERWDSFSWFGLCAFDRKTSKLLDPDIAGVTETSAIRSIELVAIL